MAGQHLVFVAGASPQIITETVCVLLSRGVAVRGIDVLTTEAGRQAIVNALWSKNGHWRQFVAAYPAAKHCLFSPRHIMVLRDAHGAPLQDVRSAADSEAAGNEIADFLGSHTRDGCLPLHASIAGGRKTMGYLLAAAMMLYGRAEDRLSHVLVHPAELEGTDFFFPPHAHRDAFHCYRGPGKKVVRVKASEIRIELAELPFLRLRALRDPAALRAQSFKSLVDQMQADLEVLTRPLLEIDTGRTTVICSDREVRLRPVEFEIYRLLAERRLRCKGRACGGCETCGVPAGELTRSFRADLSDRMRRRQSSGVHEAKWDERDFRSHVSKINRALDRVLRAGGRPFRISSSGERGHLLYGIGLSPECITLA